MRIEVGHRPLSVPGELTGPRPVTVKPTPEGGSTRPSAADPHHPGPPGGGTGRQHRLWLPELSELTSKRIRTTAGQLGVPHLAEAPGEYVARSKEAKMGNLDFGDLVLSEESRSSSGPPLNASETTRPPRGRSHASRSSTESLHASMCKPAEVPRAWQPLREGQRA